MAAPKQPQTSGFIRAQHLHVMLPGGFHIFLLLFLQVKFSEERFLNAAESRVMRYQPAARS